MQRDLLIPTAWDLYRLKPMLDSIARQTSTPDRVIFFIHGSRSVQDLEQIQEIIIDQLAQISSKIIFVHHQNSNYQPHQGIWYDRNRLASQAISEFVYMIDDDNVFGETFFAECISEYKEKQETRNQKQDILYSPLIGYRDTDQIQSSGIRSIHRWMPAMFALQPSPQPSPNRRGSTQGSQIQMIWANSLLWPRSLFQEIWFDERYRSCLEDVDFSYRVYLSGAEIVVSDDIVIQHMERQKSLLETKFLWSPEIAYERSHNRILFCKKNATLWQQIQYFWFGLWAQTGWFVYLVLRYGERRRWKLFGAVVRGTVRGVLNW